MTTHSMTVDRGDARQYVTVRIGGQLFGLPIETVNEVFSPDRITAVPLSASEIAGVLNLRGRIVTMLDMRRLLGVAPATGPSMAVGIESAGEAFGLMIDEVGDVLLLEDVRKDPNPSNIDPHWAPLVDGVYRLPGELMLVLDVQSMLARVTPARAA